MRKTKKNSKQKMAYKFLAKPNSEQIIMFSKTFGCCRKLWNLMLDDHNFFYAQLGKYLYVTPADYKELDEYAYLREVDSLALANVQMNLESAFSAFFAKKAKYPRFKSKKSRQSYTTNNVNNAIRLENINNKDYIKLPKVGLVEINKHRTVQGKIKNVTVSKDTDDRYYVSIITELEVEYPELILSVRKEQINAMDYKSDGLYQDANGVCNMPKYYKNSQNKLSKLQRSLSKKQKDSNNYKKQVKKIGKLSKHISNQRLDYLHKDSTAIAKQYQFVIVEDLDLKQISSKKTKYHLGKATNDNGFGIYRTLLDYKLKRNGGLLIKTNKYFASTQICSCCGYKNSELKDLSIRKWTCPQCGQVHDRDQNSVSNLLSEGIRILETEYKVKVI